MSGDFQPFRPSGHPKEATISEKYTAFAPLYDLLSGEYPIYRAGRVRGIAALAPVRGQQILDIGCGTGLNFTRLQERIGPSGTIVGIDRSADMLSQAQRRSRSRGWANVILIRADMLTLDPAAIRSHIADHGGTEFSNGALATYSLSLMPEWRTAWANLLALLAQDARTCVVDMQEPVGRTRWLTPLARFACRLGGSDINAHPWHAVEESCFDVSWASARGGHLQIRAGTIRQRR